MNNPDQENHLVVVPFTELSENTLNKVIQAFVLREGTDYGEKEFSLEQKVEQVFEQLKQKKVEITFNINEESFDIKRVSA